MNEKREQAVMPLDEAAAVLEKVVIGGDLSKLNPAERWSYYQHVCASLGLNPLTQPFAYVQLRGRGLTLYALKTATDQLRKIHGVSITRLDVSYQDDLVVVTVTAGDRSGRTDTDVGVVALGRAVGEDRANAVLKCVTKAKRRVTLSICGLGMLDETEVDTIPGAQVVVEPQHGHEQTHEPAQTAALRPPQPPGEGTGHGNDPDPAPATKAPQTPAQGFVDAAATALAQPGAEASGRPGTEAPGRQPPRDASAPHRPAPPADPHAALRAEVVALCSVEGTYLEQLRTAAGGKMPQEWTEEQLRKALPWLRRRLTPSAQLSARLAAARSDAEVQALLQEARAAKDQRTISQVEYLGLQREAQTRTAALSGPLTAGAGPGVAS